MKLSFETFSRNFMRSQNLGNFPSLVGGVGGGVGPQVNKGGVPLSCVFFTPMPPPLDCLDRRKSAQFLFFKYHFMTAYLFFVIYFFRHNGKNSKISEKSTKWEAKLAINPEVCLKMITKVKPFKHED